MHVAQKLIELHEMFESLQSVTFGIPTLAGLEKGFYQTSALVYTADVTR